MNELTVVAIIGIIGGMLMGYFMTRTMLKDIGIPPDERAKEIAKLSAVRTLELVFLVDVIALYYAWLVMKSQTCINLATMIFATILLGNWAFKAYYARRL
ncbi:DUF2178 domain-containing protein [Thermococcus sp. 21S9]|uniref:DUF2178 domain-containing protein n=1 Tax=Thermococcus sp. 21S9 TaxID=1638223 RepID=UPI00143B966E|nr:DUF2178 domain-containing protein [Thermococcus sp. 21S9]